MNRSNKFEIFLNHLNSSIETKYNLYVTFVIFLSIFTLFYKLGTLPVICWDEARNGVSAYEMLIHKDFINVTYLDKTDYWNTKPPLFLWMVAISYKIFGESIFSLRFPSALLAFINILLTMFFAKKIYGKKTSIISGIILSTCYGFLNLHSARSGNFDSPLAFFITLSVILLFYSRKQKFLFYISGLCAGLSFMVKSFAVAQLFLVTFFYILFSDLLKIFKPIDYIIYFLFFFAPILPWLLLRYNLDGFTFFNSMIKNDLLNRTTSNVDLLPSFPFFYPIVLLGDSFPWSLILLIAPFYKNELRIENNNEVKISINLSNFYKEPIIFFWLVIPFIMFSLIRTKVDWYLVPIYPPFAIFCGWHIAEIFEKKSFLFLNRKSIFIGVCLTILTYLTLLITIIEIQSKPENQILIYNLPKNKNAEQTFYFLKRIRNQDEVFIARVLKNYNIKYIEKIEDFLNTGKEGDLIFSEVDEINIKILSNLKIISSNNSFIILSKAKM